MLSLSLLGNPRVTRADGVTARFRSDKTRALLFFLALEHERAQTREYLSGLFWGEQTDSEARHNLSQTLLYLGQALGKETVTRVLDISRAAIQFKTGDAVHVDVYEFLELLRACETHPHRRIEACAACIARLERAGALYQGELLAQFFLNDCAAFEEWLLVQREHFQRLALTALTQVTAHYEEQGAAGYAETLRYARRQIELEAWREEPYRVLMRTHAALGQTDAALAEYQKLAALLNQELGLAPSAETTALYKHLRGQLSVVGGQSSVVSNLAPISNLPLPTTPLVGREIELAHLAEKIGRADCRMVTLVGQGGIGKTRLAIQSARDNHRAFPHGAYFVDLAEIVSPALIPNAIADALQFHFHGAQTTTQQIIQHLQNIPQPLLLVMDNFEQLVAGAPFVSDLLKRAPNVTLLLTSRERLNIQAEWLFEVEGLLAPKTVPTRLPDDWDEPAAVQLFVQCAARAEIHASTWNEDEKRAAIQLTQLVEGMPLAIELAAAWVRTMTPIEIAAEIARGLDVFHTTRRDLPARHASIRAVFEHSWVLLTAEEQQVFARLSVLRGSMTRDAAREIAGASLQTLTALVDKSLVKRAAGGRFRLHELVRQFAAEKLSAEMPRTSESAWHLSAPQTQHAHYFLELLARRGQELNGTLARDALAELRREGENVRAAWQCAVRAHELSWLERGVAALSAFYQAAGLIQEGEALLRETLDALDGDSINSALTSEIYAYLARFYLSMADYPQVQDAAQRALDMGRATGTVTSQVRGEWLLGVGLGRQNRAREAVTHLENALHLAQRENLPILEAEILNALGDPALTQVTKLEAEKLLARALDLAETHGDQRLASNFLGGLAQLANHQGKLAEAEALLQRVLPLKRILGDPAGELRTYMNLGTLAVFSYQLDKAQALYSQAVTLAWEIGDQVGWIHALVNHAGSYMVAGAYESARQAYHEAFTHAQESGDMWAIQNAAWGLGAIENAEGAPERVLEYAQTFLEVATKSGDETKIAFGRLGLAQAREGLGDAAEAEMLYRQAMQALQANDAHADALRCVAGLARLDLARGAMAEARALASDLLEQLTVKLPAIDVEPLRLYLTCYRVLSACADPRAAAVLQTAQELLHTQAAAIQESSIRKTFLENVPWHREIVEAWQAARG